MRGALLLVLLLEVAGDGLLGALAVEHHLVGAHVGEPPHLQCRHRRPQSPLAQPHADRSCSTGSAFHRAMGAPACRQPVARAMRRSGRPSRGAVPQAAATTGTRMAVVRWSGGRRQEAGGRTLYFRLLPGMWFTDTCPPHATPVSCVSAHCLGHGAARTFAPAPTPEARISRASASQSSSSSSWSWSWSRCHVPI